MTDQLDPQIDAVKQAVHAADGRLPADLTAGARHALDRADARLLRSADHTVVALGGATGSGKSSLFNALSGIDLAGVGVRRPTTSWTLACTWGSQGAADLLDWIGIPSRHQLTRTGPLGDSAGDTADFEGLVLLDMPDHDSVFDAHHAEVDRVVEYADLFIWVLDPQKYADAALHDNYLKPLGRNKDITLVVLNQIDRLSDADRELALADLRDLLTREGLLDVPIIATSAKTGEGLAELRAEVSGRVRAKRAARARLAGQLTHEAELLARAGGSVPAIGVTDQAVTALQAAGAAACNVDAITGAVRQSIEISARQASDWPPFALLGRRRVPGALPPAEPGSAANRAKLELDTRRFAETVGAGLTAPWRGAVTRAALGEADVTGHLSEAVNAVEPPGRTTERWWPLVRAAQWSTFLVLIVAAVLLVLAWTGVIGLGRLIPLIFVVAALAIGIVLMILGRQLGSLRAGRTAKEYGDQLVAAIDTVLATDVIAPVQRELAAHETFRTSLDAATAAREVS